MGPSTILTAWSAILPVLLLVQLAHLAQAAHLPDLAERASSLNVNGYISPSIYKGSGLTTRSTAAQFQASKAFDKWIGTIRSLKSYTTVYGPQQKAVSPFSPTILAQYHFRTNAARLCASRCDQNVNCGGIEMFVERVPVNASNPTSLANFWVTCRQQRKQLVATDANFVERQMGTFTRTQTAVYFANKDVWTAPKMPTASCSASKACPVRYSCNGATGKCLLSVGSTCPGLDADSTCTTGLCTSPDPTTAALCVVQGQANVQRGQHCITSADCEAKGVCASNKRCAAPSTTTNPPPPPKNLTCTPACSATQYCSANTTSATCINKAGASVACNDGSTCLSGTCTDGMCGAGELAALCSAAGDCGSGFCVQGMCAPTACGTCQKGQLCAPANGTTTALQCLSLAGGPCESDEQCLGGKCGGTTGCTLGGPSAPCSIDGDCISNGCTKQGNATIGSCTTANCGSSCTGAGVICDTTTASSAGNGLAACKVLAGGACTPGGAQACLSGDCPSTGDNPTCPTGAVDAACSGATDCQGNACNIASGQTIGSCAAGCESSACTAPKVCLAGSCISPGAFNTTCISDAFCTSGSCIHGSCAATTNGTCVLDTDCTGGTFCNSTATAPTCIPKASFGASCVGPSGCITGLCQALSGGSQTCQPSQVNGPCSLASDCTTGNCLSTGLCGDADYIPPPPPLLMPGIACTLDTQCSDGKGGVGKCTNKVCAQYLSGAKCSNNNDCQGNICSLSGTCTGDCISSGPCAAGTYCLGSTCQALQTAGGTCTANAGCTTGSCSSGSTAGKCSVSSPGGACQVGSGSDCASGFCLPPDAYSYTSSFTPGTCGTTCSGLSESCQYCNNGTATNKILTGASSSPCSDNVQCASGTCSSGQCAGCALDADCSGALSFCKNPSSSSAACAPKSQAGGFCSTDLSSSADGQCTTGSCDTTKNACALASAAGTCADNNDCTSNYCNPAARPHALGQCAADCSANACAAGSYCQGSSSAASCEPMQTLNGQCNANAACTTGTCSSSSTGTPGTCTPAADKGACQVGSGQDCKSGFCVPPPGWTYQAGMFTAGTCAATCTGCLATEYCGSSGCTAKLATTGTPNACNDGVQCVGGSCVAGTCAIACATAGDCASVANQPLGADCYANSQCASNTCNAAATSKGSCVAPRCTNQCGSGQVCVVAGGTVVCKIAANQGCVTLDPPTSSRACVNCASTYWRVEKNYVPQYNSVHICTPGGTDAPCAGDTDCVSNSCDIQADGSGLCAPCADCFSGNILIEHYSNPPSTMPLCRFQQDCPTGSYCDNNDNGPDFSFYPPPQWCLNNGPLYQCLPYPDFALLGCPSPLPPNPVTQCQVSDIQDNQTCTGNADCQPANPPQPEDSTLQCQYYCDPSAHTCATRVVIEYVSDPTILQTSCTGDADCNFGDGNTYYCDTSIDLCAQQIVGGQSCDATNPSAAQCTQGACTVSGTCPTSANGSCLVDEDCSGGRCNSGTCCIMPPGTGPPGSKCVSDNDCLSVGPLTNSNPAYCDVTLEQPVCKPKLIGGTDCDPNGPSTQCTQGACDTTTHKCPVINAESLPIPGAYTPYGYFPDCYADSDCATNQCRGGGCIASIAGEPCQSPGDCYRDLYHTCSAAGTCAP